jgi:hypothetical protein
VHLVGFTIEIFFDARSYKRQIRHLISDVSTVTDGAVDIVTRLQAGRSGVRIAAGASSLSVQKCLDRLWGPPNYLFDRYLDYFQVVKATRSWIIQLTPSISQFKNEWSCTYSLPACFRGMCRNFNISLQIWDNVCFLRRMQGHIWEESERDILTEWTGQTM